jgi:hypothetical protein
MTLSKSCTCPLESIMGFLSGPIWVTRGGVPLAPIQNHHDVDCRRKNLSLRELREKYLEWVSRNIWVMSRWNQYIYGELILASRIRLQIFPPKKCFSPHDWMNGFSLSGSRRSARGKKGKTPLSTLPPLTARMISTKKSEGRGRAVLWYCFQTLAPLHTIPARLPVVRSWLRSLVARGLGANKRRSFSREKNCDITSSSSSKTP